MYYYRKCKKSATITVCDDDDVIELNVCTYDDLRNILM